MSDTADNEFAAASALERDLDTWDQPAAPETPAQPAAPAPASSSTTTIEIDPQTGFERQPTPPAIPAPAPAPAPAQPQPQAQPQSPTPEPKPEPTADKPGAEIPENIPGRIRLNELDQRRQFEIVLAQRNPDLDLADIKSIADARFGAPAAPTPHPTEQPAQPAQPQPHPQPQPATDDLVTILRSQISDAQSQLRDLDPFVHEDEHKALTEQIENLRVDLATEQAALRLESKMEAERSEQSAIEAAAAEIAREEAAIAQDFPEFSDANSDFRRAYEAKIMEIERTNPAMFNSPGLERLVAFDVSKELNLAPVSFRNGQAAPPSVAPAPHAAQPGARSFAQPSTGVSAVPAGARTQSQPATVQVINPDPRAQIAEQQAKAVAADDLDALERSLEADLAISSGQATQPLGAPAAGYPNSTWHVEDAFGGAVPAL